MRPPSQRGTWPFTVVICDGTNYYLVQYSNDLRRFNEPTARCGQRVLTNKPKVSRERPILVRPPVHTTLRTLPAPRANVVGARDGWAEATRLLGNSSNITDNGGAEERIRATQGRTARPAT